jgi:O-antigen/teichoic acid export membrane protein
VTSILLSGRLLGVAFGLINAVVLARVLGVTALGEYAYAMGLVALFGLVPNSGLSTVITRAIALDPDHNGQLFSMAQRTQVLLGMGVFAAIMAMAMALPQHIVSVSDIALAGAQLVLGSLSIPYLAVLAGRARYDLAAVVELSVACLGTASFLVVAAYQGGLTDRQCGRIDRDRPIGCEEVSTRQFRDTLLDGWVASGRDTVWGGEHCSKPVYAYRCIVVGTVVDTSNGWSL